MGRQGDAFLMGLAAGATEGLLKGIAGNISESKEAEKRRKELEQKGLTAFQEAETDASRPLSSVNTNAGDAATIQELLRELQGSNPDLSMDISTASGLTREALEELRSQMGQAQSNLAETTARERVLSRNITAREEKSRWDQLEQAITSRYSGNIQSPAPDAERDKQLQEYQKSLTHKEKVKQQIERLKERIKKHEKYSDILARGGQAYGGNVMLPSAGFDGQMGMGTPQIAEQLGAMAAARRQLNGMGLDQKLAGEALRNYAYAMDRTLPISEQAAAWHYLHRNMGIPLPKPVEAYLFNSGASVQDIMGSRTPASSNPLGWETMTNVGAMGAQPDPMYFEAGQ